MLSTLLKINKTGEICITDTIAFAQNNNPKVQNLILQNKICAQIYISFNTSVSQNNPSTQYIREKYFHTDD